MHKVNLCAKIAPRLKGVDNPSDVLSFADADLLLGLGAAQEITQTTGGVDLKCPRCGFSQADFKKSGRLGCPECYSGFCRGFGRLAQDDISKARGTRARPSEALTASCATTRGKLKLTEKRLSHRAGRLTQAAQSSREEFEAIKRQVAPVQQK